jgi:hypothetical protein
MTGFQHPNRRSSSAKIAKEWGRGLLDAAEYRG